MGDDSTWHSDDRAPVPTSGLGRFTDLGPLGQGASGEVRRVFDPVLSRIVALKILSAGRDEARFDEEARVSAQLEHPAIVPVHELGVFPDGRRWFTMREVRGRTLARVVTDLHLASRAAGRWIAVDGWSLRGLLDVLVRVADAVAYAHSRGVVHRDLKPSNVMVGDYGEVFVLDWGISKVTGGAPDAPSSLRSGSPDWTSVGDVVGTPSYMSPEQARGVIEVGPSADVWGLGALLLEVLSGQRPVSGPSRKVIEALRSPSLKVDPRSRGAPGPVDEPLWDLCERSLAVEPLARPRDGAAFASDLRAWLDGARSRERAHDTFTSAARAFEASNLLREQAHALRDQARARLRAVAPWAPEGERHEAWALEDRAVTLERQAALDDLEGERRVAAALALDPTLPEAHAALAARHRAAHDAALAEGRLDLADRSLAVVEAHAAALPSDHPDRGPLGAWVRGDAWLNLITDPPGAEVVAEAQVWRERRRVPGETRALGRTPLSNVPLPCGSWILKIRSEGRPEVVYPVWLGRGEAWDLRPPDSDVPAPVRLPPEVPAGSVYVPAGWWLAGGTEHRPMRRMWCDGLFVQRFPVTMDAFAAWLNALLYAGRVDEALRHAPRAPLGRHGDDGPLVLARDARGRFVTGLPDPDGDVIHGDYPAFGVDWVGAVAYAAWWREQTGQAWRLPNEFEWEKSARGVDGRRRAWGDQPDASRCNSRDSNPGAPRPARVDSFPLDVSPYGVRGVTGNVRDWTCSPVTLGWGDLGARVPPGPVSPARPPSGHAVGRGGGWPTHAVALDVVTPADDRVDFRHPAVAFRLVCSA